MLDVILLMKFGFALRDRLKEDGLVFLVLEWAWGRNLPLWISISAVCREEVQSRIRLQQISITDISINRPTPPPQWYYPVYFNHILFPTNVLVKSHNQLIIHQQLIPHKSNINIETVVLKNDICEHQKLQWPYGDDDTHDDDRNNNYVDLYWT